MGGGLEHLVLEMGTHGGVFFGGKLGVDLGQNFKDAPAFWSRSGDLFELKSMVEGLPKSSDRRETFFRLFGECALVNFFEGGGVKEIWGEFFEWWWGFLDVF